MLGRCQAEMCSCLLGDDTLCGNGQNVETNDELYGRHWQSQTESLE